MSKTSGIDAIIDDIHNQYFSTIGRDLYPIQRKVIYSVLEGNNTLGLMPTGGGKSLCYWIAGKGLDGVTLVIFPLTALMDEQALKLSQHGCTVFTLHSGIDARKQYQELIDLYRNPIKPDFIFMSPERLATDGFMEFVLQSIHNQIKLVVVDEAHCISQWGLDFRPFYKEIPHFLKAIFDNDPLPRILCLTATLNPKDKEEICRDFNIKPEHVIKSEMLLRQTIDIRIKKVSDENEKDNQFWTLLEQHKNEKILIYLDRKHGKRSTETLCEEAIRRGFRAAFFHGEMKSDQKAEVIYQFKTGELLTVFATSAFGMGIDIPDIRGVVHYLLTESTEQYYQQIGRVGRDGNPSWAVLFFSDKNIDVRRQYFIEDTFPTEQAIKDAFSYLSDNRIGHRTVNYFDAGEKSQSAYHYLVRSSVIVPICKGIESLDVFHPRKGMSLPEFEGYRAATVSGELIRTAKITELSEITILREIYYRIAQAQLIAERSPGKCMVIDVLSAELPDETLQKILADIEEKKQYRLGKYGEFIELIQTYTNSIDFHKQVGEYLGVGRFGLGRIHQTLSGDMVRSKSEVIIANILFQSSIPFKYEEPLVAPDGSWRLPDFTIEWNGEKYFWEHLGMLDNEDYERDWSYKEAWYHKYFPNQLITTKETSILSRETERIIATNFIR